MASTPSSSALSAVLRCRGNIWARSPPTRRPATSAYSLGLAGWGVRDSQAERTQSRQASAWEAFLQGERVLVGRKLSVAVKSPLVDGKALREKDSGEMKKLCHSKLSQTPGDAHAAVPGAQNALVRQLVRRLTSNLPGIYAISKMNQMIKYKTCATHPYKIVFVKDIREFSTGVLKVSITSTCLMENTGQIPSFVLTGWSVVKSTCLPLTTLVSEFMLVKLQVLCQYGGPDASQHLLSQQDDETIKNDTTEANGQIHNSTDLNSSKDSSSIGPRPQ